MSCIIQAKQREENSLNKTKTAYLIPQQHPGIPAPPGGVAASNVGQLLVTTWTRRVRRMTLSGLTSGGGSPLCAGRQGTLQRPNHCSPSLVQLLLPGHVVHAVHQRRSPCKDGQEDDITPSQTRRRGGRSDEQELGALEELFRAAIVSSRALPPSS